MTRSKRPAAALRYLVIASALLGAVGVAGHFASSPFLTTTLGPTTYIFAANPGTEATRVRNATLGHGAAILIGLAALATFGLWRHPSISATTGPTLAQVGAAAAAAGLTLFVLELVRSHHAPAATTALLVATGFARPGKPLIGLVIGLAIVLVLGPLSARLPLGKPQDSRGLGQPKVVESNGLPR
jgi:HPP family